MNQPILSDFTPSLLPALIRQLTLYLKIPNGYYFHIEDCLDAKYIERCVYIFKNEEDKKTSYIVTPEEGDPSRFLALLSASLYNKGERRLYLYFKPEIVPHWNNNEKLMNENLRSVFKDFAKSSQLISSHSSISLELIMR